MATDEDLLDDTDLLAGELVTDDIDEDDLLGDDTSLLSERRPKSTCASPAHAGRDDEQIPDEVLDFDEDPAMTRADDDHSVDLSDADSDNLLRAQPPSSDSDGEVFFSDIYYDCADSNASPSNGHARRRSINSTDGNAKKSADVARSVATRGAPRGRGGRGGGPIRIPPGANYIGRVKVTVPSMTYTSTLPPPLMQMPTNLSVPPPLFPNVYARPPAVVNLSVPPPPIGNAAQSMAAMLAGAAGSCSKDEWDAKIKAFLDKTSSTRVYHPLPKVARSPPRASNARSSRSRSPDPRSGVRGLGPKSRLVSIRRPRSPGSPLDSYYGRGGEQKVSASASSATSRAVGGRKRPTISPPRFSPPRTKRPHSHSRSRSRSRSKSRERVVVPPPATVNRQEEEAKRLERQAQQEATWRQEAIQLGVNVEQYVAKLCEQRRIREEKQQEKAARRLGLLVGPYASTCARTCAAGVGNRDGRVHGHQTSSGHRRRGDGEDGQIDIHQSGQPTAPLPTEVLRAQLPSSQLACVPKATGTSSRLKPAPLLSGASTQQRVSTRRDNAIQSQQEQTTAEVDSSSKPAVSATNTTTTTTASGGVPVADGEQRARTQPSGIHQYIRSAMAAKTAGRTIMYDEEPAPTSRTEPSATKTLKNFRISIGGASSAGVGAQERGRSPPPQDAGIMSRLGNGGSRPRVPVSTLSQRITEHMRGAEARRRRTISGEASEPVVRKVHVVAAPAPVSAVAKSVDNIDKPTRPAKASRFFEPQPAEPELDFDEENTPVGGDAAAPVAETGPKLVAEVAAVIVNAADETPLKKFEIIANTVGAVKVCSKPAGQTKIFIVFKEPSHAADFVTRYNGMTIGGAQLNVQLDAYYHNR